MDELKELLIHIKNDELEYFDRFFELTKKPTFNLIYSYLRDSMESEDILQETYLKFLRYKRKVKEDMNILAYLMQIAKSLSLNYLKKNKKVEILEETDHLEDEKEEVHNLDDSPVVRKMRRVLNENEFQIVILHVVNNMTHKEIAEFLNKPLGTITWAYNNAIKKVRDDNDE
ncbi:MAG: sigma-70 family RNA polymerase sigma factor [Acholeplasmatales bacterium]|nr:sigma-70 family RNA polymerase sigma factor [Acholeplasmatales bacterium]